MNRYSLIVISLVVLLSLQASSSPAIAAQDSESRGSTLDRFMAVAAYTPDVIADYPESPGPMLGFVDLERYNQSGISTWNGADAQANRSTQLSRSMFQGLCMDTPDETWKEGFGIDCSAISVAMTIGSTEEAVRVYQGEFDMAAIRAALEQGGYIQEEIGSQQVYVNTVGIFGDDSPAATVLMGMGPYFFLLDDTTVVVATTEDLAGKVAATVGGDHPSVAEIDWLAPAVEAAGADTHGLLLVHPAVGESTPFENNPNLKSSVYNEERAALDPVMTPLRPLSWQWLLLVRGGEIAEENRAADWEPTQARETLVFVAENDEMAGKLAEAVPAQIDTMWSYTSRTPYRDSMRVTAATSTGNVAVIDLAINGTESGRLTSLYNAKDLRFVMVGEN